MERATTQDQRDLTKVGESRPPGPEYDDVNGWHKHINIFSRNDEYTYVINLKGGVLSLTVKPGRSGDVSVDLTHHDGTKDTIWRLDGHLRMVNKAEYDRIFGKH